MKTNKHAYSLILELIRFEINNNRLAYYIHSDIHNE